MHEKAYIVDPITEVLHSGFYITRNHDAIKVKDGKAWVNGIETKIRPGMTATRVDAEKYSRTLQRRISGEEYSDVMNAEPPRF